MRLLLLYILNTETFAILCGNFRTQKPKPIFVLKLTNMPHNIKNLRICKTGIGKNWHRLIFHLLNLFIYELVKCAEFRNTFF